MRKNNSTRLALLFSISFFVFTYCLADNTMIKKMQQLLQIVISKNHTLLFTNSENDLLLYYSIPNETLEIMPKWDGHSKCPIIIPDLIIQNERNALINSGKYIKVFLDSISIKRINNTIRKELISDWYYEIVFQCEYPEDGDIYNSWTIHRIYVLLDGVTIIKP